ncbi:transketolase [Mycoplasmoides fastidiosum]|uniref:Transketolase n=1 Tax=Mycoplasmoides fastidiosum TaxID=92758 RepID=A0ABU0LZ25_9BACT|nr:transketolase [Mycoplasmoides fastidiosum]MDQ0513954.1 transketolase [Mycoplasmoides fastidiosum]UUD37632.1 transketolase [Mycoplasmoides fastidiosum]
MSNIHQKFVAAMRGISLDAINQAKQGHIGMALGATNLAYNLIGRKMKFTHKRPNWINRDRLILSAGHGSLLLYSIHHFMGLLTKEDMQKHKQLDSKTPSHPEISYDGYIDASTGPLGQGVAMGVGMAISQTYLAKQFNRPNFPIMDHEIFVICGDGDLQEGVALEAIQLAGTLNLNQLILLHDYNDCQIDSRSSAVNKIDFVQYFQSQNFDVIILENDDSEGILAAIDQAKLNQKPTYIQVKTVIAKNTKWANQPKGHNGTLNPEETIAYKKLNGLTSFVPFEYPDEIYQHGKKLLEQKNEAYEEWFRLFNEYMTQYPAEGIKFCSLMNENLSYPDFNFSFKKTNSAIRDYIQEIMAQIEQDFWNIIGGSADLKTACRVGFTTDLEEGGRNIKYGIREFAMTAINNGIYLHSKLRTIDATFLVFSDYSKPALRLGAIMKIPSIHVFTHDSYQVGGDGPTHQPIEQLATLRAMPNTLVIRPCDEAETNLAFKRAINSQDQQVIIIGSRQPLKSFNLAPATNFAAYPILQPEKFDISILASGSEVELAVKVAEKLQAEHEIIAQVISVPILQELVTDYQLITKLKLKTKPIFAIEASNDKMWYMLAKFNRFECCLAKRFGKSADGQKVYESNGFSVHGIVDQILSWKYWSFY